MPGGSTKEEPTTTNLAVVIGAAAGGFFFVLCLLLLLCCCCCRRRIKHSPSTPSSANSRTPERHGSVIGFADSNSSQRLIQQVTNCSPYRRKIKPQNRTVAFLLSVGTPMGLTLPIVLWSTRPVCVCTCPRLGTRSRSLARSFLTVFLVRSSGSCRPAN